MDKSDCDRIFGSANIEKIETFRINGGRVDFGDDLHVAGQPLGDAVVCWSIDGRVAVKGRLFSDSLGEPQTATIEIRFRRDSGALTNPTTRSVNGQGGPLFNNRVVEKVSPIGSFNEVRIRLKLFLPDTGLGSTSSIVATRTFTR